MDLCPSEVECFTSQQGTYLAGFVIVKIEYGNLAVDFVANGVSDHLRPGVLPPVSRSDDVGVNTTVPDTTDTIDLDRNKDLISVFIAHLYD